MWKTKERTQKTSFCAYCDMNIDRVMDVKQSVPLDSRQLTYSLKSAETANEATVNATQ